MNGRGSASERVHVASLVLRPVDALREALARPADERGLLHPVRIRVEGRVVAGAVQPAPGPGPDAVRNLSGDTVFRDLELPAGTYRLAVEPEPGIRGGGFYADFYPVDVPWNPATPGSLPPGGIPHPSHYRTLRFLPAPWYPYSPELTLLRGALLWYDGTPLEGAEVRQAAALLPGVEIAATGGFVLAYVTAGVPGAVDVDFELSGVDAGARPGGAAYLAAWPPTVPNVALRPGGTVSIRQPSLHGVVLDAAGVPVEGAVVSLSGRPGAVETGAGSGRWSYHFPPLTPDGSVDVTVRHGSAPPVTVPNVHHRANAATRAPTVRLP